MSTNGHEVYSGLYRCSVCHLISLQPYPNQGEVASWYSASGNWELLSGDELAVPISRRRQWIEAHSSVSKGRLFEIGASRGDFLNAMSRSGWDVAGLEPGEKDVETARLRFGIELQHDYFTAAHEGQEKYDVVVAWDVLEHCLFPTQVLRAMLTYVKPGGLLCLSVPHVDGLQARVFRSRWRYRMTPIHVHFFPLRWFDSELARLGADVVDIVGFAKAHAILQSVVPRPVWNEIKRRMPAHAETPGRVQASKREVAKDERLLDLRRLLRRSLLVINQSPVPLGAADLIDVMIRKKV